MAISIPEGALPTQVKGIELVHESLIKYLDNNLEHVAGVNIVGGAGAGKSWTTINGILPTVFSTLDDSTDYMIKFMGVYVTTTTHQANNVISAELTDAGLAERAGVSTIHSHLRIKPWSGTCRNNPDQFRDCGYSINDIPNPNRMIILVDEAFRIDPNLWAVMQYLRPNAFWINTYDAYQTPPVGFNTSPIDELDIPKTVFKESPRFTNAGSLAQLIVALRKCVSDNKIEYMDIFESFKDVAYEVVDRRDYGKAIREAVANNSGLPNDTLMVCGTRKAATRYNNAIHKLRGQAGHPLFEPNDNILLEWVVGAQESQLIDSLRRDRVFLPSFQPFIPTITTKGYELLKKFKYLHSTGVQNTYLVPLFEANSPAPYKLYRDCVDAGIIIIGIRLNYARTVHTAQGMSVPNVYVDVTSIKQWANHDMRRRLLYTGASRCSGVLKVVE